MARNKTKEQTKMTNAETLRIQKIVDSYTVKEKETDKFEQLKALDKKVKLPAYIFSYVYGSITSLILGTGMCFAMGVIGNSLLLGVGIGIAGILLMLTTYPIFKRILNSRKKKYGKKIFELSDSLLNK